LKTFYKLQLNLMVEHCICLGIWRKPPNQSQEKYFI